MTVFYVEGSIRLRFCGLSQEGESNIILWLIFIKLLRGLACVKMIYAWGGGECWCYAACSEQCV